jgi:hypothetical protein
MYWLKKLILDANFEAIYAHALPLITELALLPYRSLQKKPRSIQITQLPFVQQ